MYIKYVSSLSSDEYSRATFMLDIAGLATGTKTSTNDLNALSCNKAASVISGTSPTSGIYTQQTSTLSNSSSDDYYLWIKKYHYAQIIQA